MDDPDFFVAIQFRAVEPKPFYCSIDGRHTAQFLVDKPVTLPPLPGPDQAYFCINCLAEFLVDVGTFGVLNYG